MRAAGHEVLDLSDETYAAARDRALGAIAQGIDVLAVVGGDGMVHLGVNLAAETKTPLAIIAAGTGNDIARGPRPARARPGRGGRPRRRTGMPRTIDAVRHVDAARRGAVVRGRPGRRLRLASSTSAPTPGRGPRARCATTSPSCASCRCSGRSRTPSRSTACATRPGRCSSPWATDRPTAAGCRCCPDAQFDDGLARRAGAARDQHRWSSSRSSPRSSRAPTWPTRRSRSCAAGRSPSRPTASWPTPTASGSPRCR